MHYKLLFPSEYLNSADLHGKDAVLTIRRVLVQDLKTERGTEKKPVVFFEETRVKAEQNGSKEKKLVLNRTNAETIAAMHGPEVDGWSGKRITLYPTQTDAFGKTVDCIRVRPTVPSDPAPKAS